jgi:hypothetical protein
MWADYWRPLTLVFARQNDRGKRQGSRRAEKEHKGVSTENICRWSLRGSLSPGMLYPLGTVGKIYEL